MDGFKYPIASEEELVDFFNSNFLMNISYDSFTKPTKELVCSIYDKFLFDFGVEYRIPQLKAVQTDNMAMNAISFPYINLRMALSELLSKTGFIDLSFNDLSKPQRRRNQIIFSQLAGLWTRFFEAQEAWKTVSSKHEMMTRKKNEVRKKLEDKKRSYETKLLEASELKQDLPEHENELAKAAEDFANERARSTKLKSEQEKLKREMIHLKERKADLIQQNAQKKEEISESESQLVKSPEKVFAVTSRKEKVRDEVRTERQLINKQLLEKRAELNALKEELEDHKPITKVLEEFKGHLQNLKSSCLNGIQMEEEEIAAREMRISQLDIQIVKTTEIHEGVIKQKSIASRSHEQRMTTLKDMIKEIEETISNLEKEQNSNGETSSTIEHSLLQQLSKMKEDYEKDCKVFEESDLEEKMAFIKLIETYSHKFKKILSSYNN